MDFEKNILFESNYYLYFLAYVLIPFGLLYKSNFVSKSFNPDFLSKISTEQIRGFCIIGVVLHHIAAKMESPGLMKPFIFMGYLAVSAFFFLSSYSLTISTIRNEAYINNNFLKKRITKVYLPFVVVNVIALIMFFLAGSKYPFMQAMKFVTGINLLDKTQWFIIVILLFYIVFWCAFKFFRRESAAAVTTLFVIAYILICRRFDLGQWWYQSSLCFPLGIIVALYNENILNWIEHHYKMFSVFVFILFSITLSFANIFNVKGLSYLSLFLSSLLFPLCIITGLLKFKLNSWVFGLIGSLSLEIYILHMKMLYVFRHYVAERNTSLIMYAFFITLFFVAYVLSKMLAKKVRVPVQTK